jgi:hypothetical protein
VSAGYAVRTEQPETPSVCPECGWTPPPFTHVAHSVSTHRGKMHGKKPKVTRRTIFMHREVLGLETGDPRQGDHLNRNRLDNRRENLRIIASSVQAQNRTKPATHKGKPTESKYRGVYMVKKKGKWTGKWKASVDQHYLGCFGSEEEAAEAARQYRLQTMPVALD